jgi:hypothetical protein
MKYRTVIEVVTEANDRNEALDIVGEYLAGNIASGVDMRYSARPANSNIKAVVTVTALAVLLVVSVLSVANLKSGYRVTSKYSGLDAVQVPLRTVGTDAGSDQFKRAWEKKQVVEALNSIRNIER